jgi:hypothetical protein
LPTRQPIRNIYDTVRLAGCGKMLAQIGFDLIP